LFFLPPPFPLFFFPFFHGQVLFPLACCQPRHFGAAGTPSSVDWRPPFLFSTRFFFVFFLVLLVSSFSPVCCFFDFPLGEIFFLPGGQVSGMCFFFLAGSPTFLLFSFSYASALLDFAFFFSCPNLGSDACKVHTDDDFAKLFWLPFVLSLCLPLKFLGFPFSSISKI